MNEFTQPAEFLAELDQVGDLIRHMLSGPGAEVSHWPTFYRLYLEIDDLAQAVRSAGYHVQTPYCERDEDTRAYVIASANRTFARISSHQRRIVELLSHIDQWSLVKPSWEGFNYIVYTHFAPKSHWRLDFEEHYDAGTMSVDGRMLTRRVFLLDADASYRISDMDERNLDRHQVFDLSSSEVREQLRNATKACEARTNGVSNAMGDFLAAHCSSVKALLHPSII